MRHFAKKLPFSNASFRQKSITSPKNLLSLMRNFAKKATLRQKKSVTLPKKRHFARKASFCQKSVKSPENVLSVMRHFAKKASRRQKILFKTTRIVFSKIIFLAREDKRLKIVGEYRFRSQVSLLRKLLL